MQIIQNEQKRMQMSLRIHFYFPAVGESIQRVWTPFVQ